ncbi:MAG TPA: beta-L-arabinofuranosidase domain-containing protein [Armatimonadota bacterium]|nr:beta-L-arabinofuranosidase domain-containing protein [Armatimonadota bacterium]
MNRAVVPLQAQAPATGVTLTGGVFQQAFENNIGYLKGLSQDSILYWFRVKAGLPAPGEPYHSHFEDNLHGQTAALFMMGAGNSLRWREDPELRERMNEIVDGIEVSREPDGFFEPIPKSEFGTKEYPNYVRVWFNYGLTAAHAAGNDKALGLMRGMQSWFNRCDERVLVKDMMLGFQGVISNTTVYFSEVGLPEDLETTIDYYQENWWLAQLIRGDHGAIYQRPTPHGTELEAITAYMDLYRATGKPMYLNAVNGAYRMFQEKWQHAGGGIVAIEMTNITPGCLWLDPIHKYNELCCSAHWIYLSQRYHQLYPEEERYVTEIEKSLYNVIVANQAGQEHIRYHAFLDIQKDDDRYTPVSCCAGLGTRLLGSLPEFLYSLAADGIYVDIYSSSQLHCTCAGAPVTLTTETDQPHGGAVKIQVDTESPLRFKLRLRMPSWAAGPAAIQVNGKEAATGTPGTYCTLEREWRKGDTISFTIPMALRLSRYTGMDKVPGAERYALEYGPMLLGVVGPLNSRGRFIQLPHRAENPASWLEPIPGKPGHFRVQGDARYEYMPYHEIQEQMFTCYPILR